MTADGTAVAGASGDTASGGPDSAGDPGGPGGVGGPGALDVLVLAGGTGRRLGGVSKPDVVARGARLLDHVLNGEIGRAHV